MRSGGSRLTAMVELEDRELIKLYQAGQKEKVFNELVRRYQKRIYWVARRMVKRHEDADDIAQDVFLKAYTALDNFRGDSNLYTWLYRIAVNLSINHLRKQKVRKAVDIDDYLPFLSREADQAKQMIKRENVSLVEDAIEQLPEKQKAVFIMRYYDEMPYDQISDVLGTSVGGLKANYHHAVKKVTAYVKSHHDAASLEESDRPTSED